MLSPKGRTRARIPFFANAEGVLGHGNVAEQWARFSLLQCSRIAASATAAVTEALLTWSAVSLSRAVHGAERDEPNHASPATREFRS